MENPTKMDDDWGVALFQEQPYSTRIYQTVYIT